MQAPLARARLLIGVLAASAMAPAIAIVIAVGAAPTPPLSTQAGPTTDPTAVAVASRAVARSVMLISVDGLTPAALRRLGRDGTPQLHRLLRGGASTLNARTVRERTETLPNHTSMVTGRSVLPRHNGHGVTWNDERTRPRTVHQAAGHRVMSVFNRVRQAGGSSGLFASKSKLALLSRSWPRAIDRTTLRTSDRRLTREVCADLRQRDRSFRLLHLSQADRVGHDRGFGSASYLRAVARVDSLVGRIVRTLRRSGLVQSTAIIVTSDHGGMGRRHGSPARLSSFRVPFLVAGPGVRRGADLYDLNPHYADPGRKRTAYPDAKPPVRNAAAGNLALDLLGLPPISGSDHNRRQDLRVRG